MKIGGDMVYWIKIARRCAWSAFAQAAGELLEGRIEPLGVELQCPNGRAIRSRNYDPSAPEEYNEFVACAALAKRIISAKGGTKEAARARSFFGYTHQTYRRTLRKVRVLNASALQLAPLR